MSALDLTRSLVPVTVLGNSQTQIVIEKNLCSYPSTTRSSACALSQPT
jgi:hypothetical protein